MGIVLVDDDFGLEHPAEQQIVMSRKMEYGEFTTGCLWEPRSY